MHDILRTATHTILTNSEPIGAIFHQVRALHDFYQSLTGIGAHQIGSDKDVFLPSGKAIGPGQAAHCLLEGSRTAVFIRGIYKALKELQLRFPGERLNILYAGCGPYATLLTPLTTVFSSGEVSFHMMDINEISLVAAKQLYEQLELADYVSDYTLADAATYKVDKGTAYHMMISETMQQALKKEPQVSIMQNLVPQLPEQGIFIPQEIRVSAQLLNLTKETESFSVEGLIPERINLGEIYAISKEEIYGHPPVTIQLPHATNGFNHLHLMTEITVYDAEVLTTYNCSLNLPVRLFDAQQHLGKSLTFRYETGSCPGFKYEWNDVGVPAKSSLLL